jgi:integrase
MQFKDFSDRTQETFLGAVKGIAKFYGKFPELFNQQQVDDYLLHLRQSGKSASTRNAAICGLRFLCEQVLNSEDISLDFPRRREPKILPGVLSANEVASILEAPDNIKHRVILMAACPAGMRLSKIANLGVEPINKRPDADSSRSGYVSPIRSETRTKWSKKASMWWYLSVVFCVKKGTLVAVARIPKGNGACAFAILHPP